MMNDLSSGTRICPTSETLVLPVPASTAIQFPYNSLGTPDNVWIYRNAAGEILFAVTRFDQPDGGKQILPLSYWQTENGQGQWRWKGIPEPRPLYGLDQLAARPEAPVIITEGEKAADAAARILFNLAACDSIKQVRHVVFICSSVQRILPISADDFRRCETDIAYREQLMLSRDVIFTEKLTKNYNHNLAIMSLKGNALDYVQISSLQEIPLMRLDLNDAVKAVPENFLLVDGSKLSGGQKFVLSGKLFVWQESDENNIDKIILGVFSNDKTDRYFIKINTSKLNERQLDFIRGFCFRNYEEYNSLCSGELYLSVQANPFTKINDLELDGAIFSPADESATMKGLQHREKEYASVQILLRAFWGFKTLPVDYITFILLILLTALSSYMFLLFYRHVQKRLIITKKYQEVISHDLNEKTLERSIVEIIESDSIQPIFIDNVFDEDNTDLANIPDNNITPEEADRIGREGEDFVIQYEKNTLINEGRPDLANDVINIARTVGDGEGYDIRSCFLDGRIKYIEVKATNTSLGRPFHISSNELAFLRDNHSCAFIYRVCINAKQPFGSILILTSDDLDIKYNLYPENFSVQWRR